MISCESVEDHDIYVVHEVTNRDTMNSTITIVDSEEDGEIIDLESSQDEIDNVVENTEEGNTEEESFKSTQFVENNEQIIDSVHKVSSPNECVKPFIKVIFRDESVTCEYGERIKQFLEDLIKNTSQQDITCQHSKNTLEIWEKEISFEKNIETVDTIQSEDNTLYSSLFTIDTKPKFQNDFDIPRYGKKFEDTFEDKGRDSQVEIKDVCIPRIACFNCLGNHNLRDCPKPRNTININKNRKSLGRAVRYHADDDQKFGHMTPGQISQDLRDALGLRDNELPRHIYKMRILGYPPGWLEEARLQHSGLSLFNSDGVAEMDPDEEPGEIISEEDKDCYDVKKIFDFPGFNVPPPPGTHDDHKRYWAPPMDTFHSKEMMLTKLRGGKTIEGYKRKKLKLSNTSTSDTLTNMPCDMEVDDLSEMEDSRNNSFVVPLTKDSISNTSLPVHSSPLIENNKNESQNWMDESTSLHSRGNSPSLSDLETMKKQLLVELEQSGSQSKSETSTKCNLSTNDNEKSKTEASSMVNPETSWHDSTPNKTNASNTSIGSVKSIDLGTPILQSASPYNKLPSSEKFSKDICDVINFENLPDSTGKYEKMTGVLQKVRTAMANIHQE